MSTKKVLVAFDSPTMRHLMAKELEEHGYATVQAEDGVEALRAIYTDHPDCILVYIDLPVVNGYNISRIVKNSRSFKDIAVLICTTEETSVHHFWVENSHSNGMFIPDEESVEHLHELVEKTLVINDVLNSADSARKTLPNPEAGDLLKLSVEAFDRELFDLYIIQSAYNGGISEFNMKKLMSLMTKTLSGVYSYDAMNVIVYGDSMSEYRSMNPSLSAADVEDFIRVSRNDSVNKQNIHEEINWQKCQSVELEQAPGTRSGKIQSYETFPSLPNPDIPLTLHLGSCLPDSFNNRTRERLDYLVTVYAKLIRRTLMYNSSRDAESKMRQAFSHFLPPKIISDIIRGNSSVTATVGEKRRVAILIADIRSFTAISERNEPERVVEFLNEYFAIMGRIIKKHGGTIDKFIGDAIMALFGAPESYPDNANRAANAALEMRRALRNIQATLNLPEGYTFDIGTGIHYGETIVGSIGSEEKKDYTVIGDNVNIASRTEGLTKVYGTPIIITEDVKQDLQDGQYTRHLDNVKVKGKSVSIAIYELCDKGTTTPPEFESAWSKAMNQYLLGNFDRASMYFARCAEMKPGDKATEVLLDRCTLYAKERPLNWDGSYTLTTK